MIVYPPRPAKWTRLSPWLIIGMVCILAAILLFLAVRNVNREREFMMRSLLSQAHVLSHAVEAGSRTGMMGMGWGRNQTQTLLQETAEETGALYIAIVNARGRVMAHSDPDQVGNILQADFPPPGQSEHRFTREGKRAFEVVQEYQPWNRPRGGRGHMGAMWPAPEEQAKDFYLVIGLDPAPFEDASREDLHHNLLMFGILFLVGAAGLLSLTWAQHYRNARGALEDVRALTSAIVGRMPAGLILADAGGAIQESNAAALSILKRSEGLSGNLAGLSWLQPVLDRLDTRGKAVEQEVRCNGPAGEIIPLLVTGAVIRDAEQRKSGFLILFSDLTNVRRLEEQLHRSERLAGLGRLAAGVAHEIRNPLSSIKGFAAILAGRAGEKDESRRIASVMVQEVERLNRVVSELLDYAGSTRLTITMQPCRELIEDSFRLVETDARDRAVRLEWAVSPEDLQIEIDPDRFRQALLNLYLNAIQAMEGGGVLRVETLRENGMALWKISDSGSGIPAEHLAHIFDPYFTTKPKGVGLGLANVHKLVEAHGGTIEVESAVGRGTTFTIRLPLCGLEERTDAQTETSDSHCG
jgi:two-component system, NtrC family, sensor histidine kinase HydH